MPSNSKNIAELLNTDTTIAVTDVADGSITTAKLAADAVTSAKLADDSVVTANIVDGNVTAVKTTGVGKAKNILYNGAMQIHQRGNQVSSTGASVYSIDRWNFFHNGSAGVANLQQSSDVPTGQGFASSLLIDVTTAETTIDSGDVAVLRQIMEGYDLQRLAYGTSSAKSMAMSFWVKSPKTGTHVCELYHNASTTRTISKTYTVNSANTWEKKTIIWPGDTSAACDNDNQYTIAFQWSLFAGSAYTSGSLGTTWANYDATKRFAGQVNIFDSASNNFYLTGVQVEEGSVASDFEHRSFGEELALCQRYFYRFTGHGTLFYADYYSNDTFITKEPLPVEMRVNPTVTTRGTGGSGNTAFSYTNLAATPTISASGKTSVAVYRGVASAARTYIHIYNTTAAYSVDASAEL